MIFSQSLLRFIISQSLSRLIISQSELSFQFAVDNGTLEGRRDRFVHSHYVLVASFITQSSSRTTNGSVSSSDCFSTEFTLF